MTIAARQDELALAPDDLGAGLEVTGRKIVAHKASGKLKQQLRR